MNQFEEDLNAGRVGIDPRTGAPYETTSWTFVDLGAAKAGSVPAPKFLRRTDGLPLLYMGKHHSFVGPSETLKSWAAILACKDAFDQGSRALYVDFEDGEATFVERSRIAGIPDSALGESVRYMRPSQSAFSIEAITDLELAVASFTPHLVVLDGVTEAYSLHDWSVNSAEDAARWQKLVRDVFGNTTTVEVDHTGKDLERGALGSQHKRAGLNGPQYTFAIGSVPDRDRAGYAYVKVGKDRNGHVQRSAVGRDRGIATLHVDPKGRVALEPPTSEADRVAELRAQIAGELGMRGELSTSKVASAVSARRDAVLSALQAMQADGTVNRKDGPRGADVWSLS